MPTELPDKLHPTVLDTSVVQLANTYAQALYGAADRAGLAEQIADEFAAVVGEVLDRHPQLEQLMRSTLVGSGQKADMLQRLFAGRVSPLFMDFLQVVNRRGRLELLRAIEQQYRRIHDQRLGRVPVRVESAVELEAEQMRQLRDRLAALVGGQPVVQYRLNPDLIGGLVVHLDDTVYDASLRTRLNRIREQIVQRSTHEIQSRRDQFRHTERD